MATKASIVSFLMGQQRTSSTHLSGGTVSFYAAGTSSFKAVWIDALKESEAANPYTLDSRGTAIIYGDGNYRIVLRDSDNVVIEVWDDIYIGADTGSIDLSSLAAQVSQTSRDYIGNSNLNIWNYGTSIVRNTLVDTQLADGWYYTGDGTAAGTLTATRTDFTFGQTEVPENPTYYARLNKTVASAGSSFEYFVFRLPVRTAAAQQMTFRCYAKAAAAKDITIVAKQYFGVGGSPSAVTSTPAMTLTTSWAKYNKTFTLPSISGKTIGSGSYLEIGISLPTNTTFDISIASMKFELGATASVGEFRTTYEDELRTSGRIGASASFLYADLSGGTNEKYWRAEMNTAQSKFSINTLNDSQSSPVAAIEFVRSGTSIVSASLPNVPTPAGSDNSSKIATTAFVQAAALSVSLPPQAGNAGKFMTTDGTNASWGTVVMRTWRRQIFNSNGTFTVPTDVDVVFISGTGAGAGGRYGTDTALRAGGSSGASIDFYPVPVTPGEAITVTIGVGGTSGGGDGGSTIFGSYMTLEGGNIETTDSYGGGVYSSSIPAALTKFDSAAKKPGSNTHVGGAPAHAYTDFPAGTRAGTYMFGGAGGKYGPGGNGNASGAGGNAPANSGAGGGSGTTTGGTGGSGKLIVWYLGV